MLRDVLSRYWWTILVRGLLWILFGVLIVAQPGIALVTLTLLFGLFALVDGTANVVSALGGRREYGNWWVLLLAGLAGIGVAVLTFINPGITALALLFYIALWALAIGILEIVTAVYLRKEIDGEFWLALAGIASVAFGGVLIARPGSGALAVLWLIAAYAILVGVILVVLALKMRAFVGRAVA